MRKNPYSKPSGTLFIVASPIGNIRDITLRTIDVLGSVALIAAEDTRHTRKLLNAYNIKTKLFSLNEHNERTKSPSLIKRVLAGEDIAYISDAGTPGISDPSFLLIGEAIKAGVPVVPIPGASAAIAALSVSGLPINRFLFVGFLPANASGRKSALEALKDEKESIVLFESPLRLLKTLRDILAIWGDRMAVVAREMTKVYEEFQRARLSELVEIFEARATIKGEVTIIVAGDKKEREEHSPQELKDMVESLMKQEGLSHRDAARKISATTGIAKSVIYRHALPDD